MFAVELLLEIHDEEVLNLVESGELDERNEKNDGRLFGRSGNLLSSQDPEILDFVGKFVGGRFEIEQSLGDLLLQLGGGSTLLFVDLLSPG